MKTIKIFVASSEELHLDRLILGNLARRLDNIYEKWGVRIKLIEWEDLDAAYNDIRKQEEYNEYVKDSDMFVALFYVKAGVFTLEEFDVATEEYRKKKAPKVYAYCKKLQDGQMESLELLKFKEKLQKELGHYWCTYDTDDSLQLHFVMQLQLMEADDTPKLGVKDGTLVLDGFPIASFSKLQFATSNEAYQRLERELESSLMKVQKARRRYEQSPDDPDRATELQELIDDYNAKKDEIDKLQKALMQTALRISEMEHKRIGSMTKRAIEAFERGDISAANVVLDIVSQQAEDHYRQFLLDATQIHEDIDALRLQAKVLLADFSIPIQDRKDKVADIFNRAKRYAESSQYNEIEYLALVDEYGCFCDDYGEFSLAMQLYELYVEKYKQTFTQDNETLAVGYSSLSSLYIHSRDYKQALHYQLAAIQIRENNHYKRIAVSYIHCARIYTSMDDYIQAERYYAKAYELMKDNPLYKLDDWALYYTSLSIFHSALDRMEEAMEDINEAKRNIKDEDETKIGYVAALDLCSQLLIKKGNYQEALNMLRECEMLTERLRGPRHPAMAAIYNKLGLVFLGMGDTSMSDYYLHQALSIKHETFGFQEPPLILCYLNFANLYLSKLDFPNTKLYLEKCADILDRSTESNLLIKALVKETYARYLSKIGEFEKAISSVNEALEIRRKVVGESHSLVGGALLVLGEIQSHLGDYSNAIKSLTSAEGIFNSPEYKTDNVLLNGVYESKGKVYFSMGDLGSARAYLSKVKTISSALALLAGVDYVSGYVDLAEKEFKEAWALVEKEHTMSDIITKAYIKFGEGVIAYDGGDYSACYNLISQVRALLDPIPKECNGRATILSSALLYQGSSLVQLKDYKQARSIFLETKEISYVCGQNRNALAAKMMWHAVEALSEEKNTWICIKNSIMAQILHLKLKRLPVSDIAPSNLC